MTMLHPTPPYPASSLIRPPALIIERFLRDRRGVWTQISKEHDIGILMRQMLVSSAIAFAGYGAVLGFSHGLLQALSSLVKLPLLFLLALAICFPVLYVYNLLCGGRLSAGQTCALVLAAITVTAVFTLAFAPITLFFLVTARSYHFFVLLNVAVLSLTGSVGLFFLVNGALQLNQLSRMEQALVESTPPEQTGRRVPQPVRVGLLPVWLLLYGFVGVQLGWALRPFVGIPGETFRLFRSVEGDFWSSLLHMLLGILG